MRRLLATLALVATLLTAAACTPEDNRAQLVTGRTRISLGVIPIVDVAPVYLGKQHGFFSSRGIDLTLVPEQGGAPIIKGVLAGRYQFGFSNMTSLMSARTAGTAIERRTFERMSADSIVRGWTPPRDIANGSPKKKGTEPKLRALRAPCCCRC